MIRARWENIAVSVAFGFLIGGCASSPVATTSADSDAPKEVEQREPVSESASKAPVPVPSIAPAIAEMDEEDETKVSAAEKPVEWVPSWSWAEEADERRPSLHLDFSGMVMEFQAFDNFEDIDENGIQIRHEYGKRSSFSDESKSFLTEILESY